jgi:hypothetical protein
MCNYQAHVVATVCQWAPVVVRAAVKVAVKNRLGTVLSTACCVFGTLWRLISISRRRRELEERPSIGVRTSG